ncbi:hypothetical protein BRADI_1g39621v3 [Brachypodium distachyon]|uniref:Uncharacterized protein n=1 Tax=Brachypodium distachyon TaxID=15368 RepID=A0A2K2DNM9_BRADI|nr:hypothetical protein BRADI_1g39621v3 [Brachypodium distachyon]
MGAGASDAVVHSGRAASVRRPVPATRSAPAVALQCGAMAWVRWPTGGKHAATPSSRWPMAQRHEDTVTGQRPATQTRRTRHGGMFQLHGGNSL